jgi:hypothetical protein
MSRLLSQFLDQLTERFAALLAGVISSRVEGLRAVTQAEQQSQLEDLARRYEAEGKPEIAATLRKRALSLTSNDLAAEAIEVMERTAGEHPLLDGPAGNNPPALPDFTTTEPKSRRKSPKSPPSQFPTSNAFMQFPATHPEQSGEPS